MKRRIFKLTLFLLAIGAGAIINVAVAWGCNTKWPALASGSSFGNDVVIKWFNSALPCWNEYEWSVGYAIQHETTGAHVMWVTAEDRVRCRFLQGHRFRAGWPTLSVEGQVWNVYGTQHCDYQYDELIALTILKVPDVEGRVYGRFSFPYGPLFPGFALNTIFYAAIGWILFAVPGAVRRRVRRKRGQCAACGYSRRGSSGGKCPECGATAIKQKAETQKAEME